MTICAKLGAKLLNEWSYLINELLGMSDLSRAGKGEILHVSLKSECRLRIFFLHMTYILVLQSIRGGGGGGGKQNFPSAGMVYAI